MEGPEALEVPVPNATTANGAHQIQSVDESDIVNLNPATR